MYWNVFKVQQKGWYFFCFLSFNFFSLFLISWNFVIFKQISVDTKTVKKEYTLWANDMHIYHSTKRSVSYYTFAAWEHGSFFEGHDLLSSSSFCFFSPPHVFSHLSLYFHRNSTVLNSKVISVTIKPTPSSLSTPLEIEFSHLYNVSQSAL